MPIPDRRDRVTLSIYPLCAENPQHRPAGDKSPTNADPALSGGAITAKSSLFKRTPFEKGNIERTMSSKIHFLFSLFSLSLTGHCTECRITTEHSIQSKIARTGFEKGYVDKMQCPVRFTFSFLFSLYLLPALQKGCDNRLRDPNAPFISYPEVYTNHYQMSRFFLLFRKIFFVTDSTSFITAVLSSSYMIPLAEKSTHEFFFFRHAQSPPKIPFTDFSNAPRPCRLTNLSLK